jgi:hypothetical protein
LFLFPFFINSILLSLFVLSLRPFISLSIIRMSVQLKSSAFLAESQQCSIFICTLPLPSLLTLFLSLPFRIEGARWEMNVNGAERVPDARQMRHSSQSQMCGLPCKEITPTDSCILAKVEVQSIVIDPLSDIEVFTVAFNLFCPHVPSELISLQLYTSKVVGVQFELYIFYNLHLKQSK